MESIPQPPRREQIALIRRLLRTPQTALDELAERFGPICALGAGPLRMVVVGSPPLIHDVLMQPNDRYRWDTRLSPFPFVVGKHTMIASDGPDHRRRRGAVQQAFGRRRLQRWIPMIVERTDVAIDDLLASDARRSSTDLYPVGRRLLIEIVVRALFGERLVERTEEIDVRFARAQRYLSSPLYRQVPHPLPFTLRAGVRRDRAALDVLIDAAIADSRHDPPPDGGDESGDVLDALVHRSDLSAAEIRDQVKSLIGAGYDTTASSLAWILWEATTQPSLWSRIGEEADAVLKPPGAGRLPDHESLVSLELANRVMRETLRVHPASGVGAREAATDVTVGAYVIPQVAGALVAVSRRPRPGGLGRPGHVRSRSLPGIDRCTARPRRRGVGAVRSRSADVRRVRARPDGTDADRRPPRPTTRPDTDGPAPPRSRWPDRQPPGRRRTDVRRAAVAADGARILNAISLSGRIHVRFRHCARPDHPLARFAPSAPSAPSSAPSALRRRGGTAGSGRSPTRTRSRRRGCASASRRRRSRTVRADSGR